MVKEKGCTEARSNILREGTKRRGVQALWCTGSVVYRLCSVRAPCCADRMLASSAFDTRKAALGVKILLGALDSGALGVNPV